MAGGRVTPARTVHMKSSPLVVVFAGFLGLALGGGAVAWLSDSVARARPDRPREPASAHTAPAAPRSELEEPARRATEDGADARAGADNDSREVDRPAEPESLFGPAFRAYAEAELERGWAEVRSDSMPRDRLAQLVDSFVELTRTTPSRWGRSDAETQNAGEGKNAVGEPLEPSDWNTMGDEARRALASDPARFAEIFRAQASGRAHDGPTLAAGDPLADGAVVRYPAGVFRVADLARGREPFPADVTLRGAGMDATLLVMDELSPRGALERFAIEDCTVFADGGIADVRGDVAVVALRRIRLVGFDCGAGCACAMSLHREAAISAADCRFEGGYGRWPIAANLMNSPPLVARFESCSFERMTLRHAMTPAVVFASCSMSDMLWEQDDGPTYVSCRYSTLAAEQRLDESLLRRDLDQLFPGWRAELDAR